MKSWTIALVILHSALVRAFEFGSPTTKCLPILNTITRRRPGCRDYPHYLRASSKETIDGSLAITDSNGYVNGETDNIKSRIVSIKSLNLGGVTGPAETEIELDFSNGDSIAITGETGSGKSLLVSKVADLVTGGKATAALLSKRTSNASATVEMGTYDHFL